MNLDKKSSRDGNRHYTKPTVFPFVTLTQCFIIEYWQITIQVISQGWISTVRITKSKISQCLSLVQNICWIAMLMQYHHRLQNLFQLCLLLSTMKTTLKFVRTCFLLLPCSLISFFQTVPHQTKLCHYYEWHASFSYRKKILKTIKIANRI